MAATAAETEEVADIVTSPSNGAGEISHKRRAAENGFASPRKKARNDQSEEDSNGFDDGEVSSDAGSEAKASSMEAGRPSGWNSGVTNQLRTSFGSKSKSTAPKALPKAVPASAKLSPPPETLAPEIRSELVAAIQAGETTTIPQTKERDLLWEVPKFRADFVGGTWNEIFESIYTKWSADFVAKNKANIKRVGLDPHFLNDVYLRTLEGAVPRVNPKFVSVSQGQLDRMTKDGQVKKVAKGWTTDRLSRGEKKQLQSEVRESAKEPTANETKSSTEPPRGLSTRLTRSSVRIADSGTSEAGSSAVSSGRKTSATPSDLVSSQHSPAAAEEDAPMDISDEDGKYQNVKYDQRKVDNDASRQMRTEAALEHLHRYFPGVPDDALFCVTCASYGHNAPVCPETTCKFCHEGHFSYSCPSRHRCAKCKQLGHSKASCKEKLAMAPGEGFMECAFCQAQDHQEDRCTEIWETYRPQIGHIKRVKSVPIFCYCCGAEGHFGTDCGLADPKVLPSATWNNAAASMYIDPTSSEEAIAFKNPLPQAQPMSAPVIPGRSIKPQSHIIFEDSGDDDNGSQGFLRAPAAGHRRPGQIQITSNIRFDSSGGTSAQNESSPQQGTANSRQRRKPRATHAPASLPPKPTSVPQMAPGPQVSKKGKKNNNKKGSGRSSQQQQPPLPPGPPPGRNGWRPPEFQGRGANSSRGRGGFSNLSRGGGGRRGGGRS